MITAKGNARDGSSGFCVSGHRIKTKTTTELNHYVSDTVKGVLLTDVSIKRLNKVKCLVCFYYVV